MSLKSPNFETAQEKCFNDCLPYITVSVFVFCFGSKMQICFIVK
ncbi:hypothetical protein HMPREF2533_04600 [Bacteroides fragilis]|nr:hypothetical protein HMPREF2533_04600 [Bacteroides fragilis]KXU40194.1 hypothetical protein HMPREF2530_04600 [Bacteroides fragilis]